jgi:Amt family ammonium transporter
VQLVGVVATVVWSVAVTFVIVKATGTIVGLRVDEDEAAQGLDLSAHGESGYSL